MTTHLTTKGSILCATLIGLAACAPGMHAQSSYPVARADIPFAFHYGTRTLPAGVYTLRMTANNIMAMQGAPGNTSLGIVLRADADTQPGRSELVFRHQGTEFLLRDVWVPGHNIHLVCPQAKLKSAKHGEVASVKNVDSSVEVALVENPR